MGLWRIPRRIREAEDEARREAARRARGPEQKPLRLIVCGDSTDRAFIFAALDYLRRTRGVDEILMPDEPGAAVLAAEWAAKHGIDCIEHLVDWREHGSAARERRNDEMLRTAPSGIVVIGDDASGISDAAASTGYALWKPRFP